MTISLKHTGTGQTLTLSDRLLWVNEYAWSPAAHEARYGTTGALLLHVGLRQAGRPIELDGRDSEAWLARAACAQLQQWAAQPGQTFELLLRGVLRAVVFDHSGGNAFDAEPIWKLVDGEHTPELEYRPYFRFMEV
jgi:hypothetical protein